MTPKPKMGRPRRAKKESAARLVARCTEAELRAAEQTAEALQMSLSTLVRAAVAHVVEQKRLGGDCPLVLVGDGGLEFLR